MNFLMKLRSKLFTASIIGVCVGALLIDSESNIPAMICFASMVYPIVDLLILNKMQKADWWC